MKLFGPSLGKKTVIAKRRKKHKRERFNNQAIKILRRHPKKGNRVIRVNPWLVNQNEWLFRSPERAKENTNVLAAL